MRGKVKIFGLNRTLSGPSHHNKVIQDMSRSRLRDMKSMGIRDHRTICRHKECSLTSRRKMGALRPKNIRYSEGCCKRLGCKVPSSQDRHIHRVQRCKRLGCTLPSNRVHRIRDQSSKFRASPFFSRLRQQRRLKRSAEWRKMQSKQLTKIF